MPDLARHDRLPSLDSMEETTDVVLRRARNAGGGGLLPDERSPEKAAGDAELTAITRAFIDSLTDEEKSFFHHRFVGGLTQEATADEMGCTRARVKLLVKNLRGDFLEKLRGRGYFVDHDMKPRWSRKAA